MHFQSAYYGTLEMPATFITFPLFLPIGSRRNNTKASKGAVKVEAQILYQISTNCQQDALKRDEREGRKEKLHHRLLGSAWGLRVPLY
jgi:hypothetical protein